MIVCIRNVSVPPASRAKYLSWIRENRALREHHGILFEIVLEETPNNGDCVVITAWPSHDVFDAWIASPERDALTASAVHASVNHQPITRHEIAAGYFNAEALGKGQLL